VCAILYIERNDKSFVPTRSLPRPSVKSCEKRGRFSIDEKGEKEKKNNLETKKRKRKKKKEIRRRSARVGTQRQ
jgi:hypothetical protein